MFVVLRIPLASLWLCTMWASIVFDFTSDSFLLEVWYHKKRMESCFTWIETIQELKLVRLTCHFYYSDVIRKSYEYDYGPSKIEILILPQAWIPHFICFVHFTCLLLEMKFAWSFEEAFLLYICVTYYNEQFTKADFQSCPLLTIFHFIFNGVYS